MRRDRGGVTSLFANRMREDRGADRQVPCREDGVSCPRATSDPASPSPTLRRTATASPRRRGEGERDGSEMPTPAPPSCDRPDAPRSCSRADATPIRRTRHRWRARPRRRQRRHRFLHAAVLRGLILRRDVVQHRRQPALGFRDAPALARGVVLDLVALDLADAEIEAFGMAEIKPRYRRARPHRIAFGQLHAGGVLGIEQREQRRLLGVIGLRGIAGRGADAGYCSRISSSGVSVSSGA